MAEWKAYFSPIEFITGSLLLFIILLVFIFYIAQAHIKKVKENEQQKRIMQKKHNDALLANSIEIQERERSRIAADIHDDLIGKLRLIALQENKKINGLQECIALARNISHELSPLFIEDLSLAELFQSHVNKMSTHFSINLTILQDTMFQNMSKKLHHYRIFQEVITNIEKHSKSKTMNITLRVTNSSISFIVKDYGIGLNPSKSDGLGMKNIELRTSQLGAIHKFAPNQPRGTKFIIHTQL